MNNYHATSLSGTTGANRMVMLGALAAQLAFAGAQPASVEQAAVAVLPFEAPYRVDAVSLTLDQFGSVLEDGVRSAPDLLEQAAVRFYARLVDNQEELGADLERVLHENLWELYEV